jgi:carboxynorspermidine decarboxylase
MGGSPVKESRPAFAGLGGLSPEELFGKLPTPCYILDEAMLRRNGEILAEVADRTGCRILLAQKAFSNYDLYPVLSPYLDGTEASGLYEARLGAEEMPGKEVHVFCAAYREEEFDELLRYADHIVFNSPRQLERFGPLARKAGKSVGLRVNPERSTQEGHAIYDPCAPGSRLGTTRAQWDAGMTPELIELLDGLHFHTLCEQDAGALEITLDAVAERFGDILPRMKWLNFGGGHHITRPGYDIPRLERCIRRAQEQWDVLVYLEPGEACALNAGYLAARVLDVLQNGGTRIAVLDASAACHMPDVLEMPYRPPLYGAKEPGELSCAVRLGGPTCLAGDVIGEYSFAAPPQEGDLLLFGDMAIYTMCKNNTFNGVPLPGIFVLRDGKRLQCLKKFEYTDFQQRLGRQDSRSRHIRTRS